MAKCAICKNTLVATFLEKTKGTVVYKEGSSTKYWICFECQKKFHTKEEMLEQL